MAPLVLDLVYRTKITLREGYLRILLFIEYSIIKNRNILDKNKYINNIKYPGLPLVIPYLVSHLYLFQFKLLLYITKNSSYNYESYYSLYSSNLYKRLSML
jgi:hypothetical protein